MNGPIRCPACDGERVEDMAALGPVPVLCGSLWDSREEALATPSAELELVGCQECAHVWNSAFDPALVEYDAKYDNALDFSPVFNDYAQALADRLIDTFDLRGRDVVEIGSGKGEFLRQLCAAGDNRGVGYDPTYEGPEVDGTIRFVREFFTPSSAPEAVDFVSCRHVLEHLDDPSAFLLDVRKAVQDRPVPMYFEVPNAEFNFAETGPWDLIYPHVGYFSDTSLRALLERAGFQVDRVEPSFNGQFLSAEVHVAPAMAHASHWDADHASTLARSYAAAIERQLEETTRWRERLHHLGEQGPIALWGAGSKGVTFLSLIDVARQIATVVDANPRKWHRYLPQVGHEIVAPREIATRSVQSVLVMNPAYQSEIRDALRQSGAGAEVLVV